MRFIHSRKTGYFLLVVGVLGLELVLAWRVALVYAAILAPIASHLEVVTLQLIVFLAVAIFGFTLATHRQYGVAAIRAKRAAARESGQPSVGRGAVVGSFLAVIVVILHDWGGTLYSIFGQGQQDNVGVLAVSVGMCGLALIPFLVSGITLALAESLSHEEGESFERKKRKLREKHELARLGASLKRAGEAPEAEEEEIEYVPFDLAASSQR